MKYNKEKLLQLSEIVIDKFTSEDWELIASITDTVHIISDHSRLLKSLRFQDSDYAGNAISVIRTAADYNKEFLNDLEAYINKKYNQQKTIDSPVPALENEIKFSPTTFTVPNVPVESNLVAVMMPFAGFDTIHQTIRLAAEDAQLVCLRADDIWEEATVIQEVFNLIYRAAIVVVDFTGKNPNVMYETGIAHTLGKVVIPITQNKNDVPSDIIHHKFLHYLNNKEGLEKLRVELSNKLKNTITKMGIKNE